MSAKTALPTISARVFLRAQNISHALRLGGLGFLLLFDLEEKSAVDVREDTSKSDGGADQGIQFFVAADGELEMAGCDTLDLQVLGSILWREYRVSRTARGDGRGKGNNEGTGKLAGNAAPETKLTPASSSTSAVRYSSTAVT